MLVFINNYSGGTSRQHFFSGKKNINTDRTVNGVWCVLRHTRSAPDSEMHLFNFAIFSYYPSLASNAMKKKIIVFLFYPSLIFFKQLADDMSCNSLLFLELSLLGSSLHIYRLIPTYELVVVQNLMFKSVARNTKHIFFSEWLNLQYIGLKPTYKSQNSFIFWRSTKCQYYILHISQCYSNHFFVFNWASANS